MKSYIVDRSSSTPQLTEMPTNVEKIYQTKEAAETALANGDIADGEFVSTVDTVTDEGDKFDKSYLSYSTEETLTGGTWIDGKPIYRVCQPVSGNVDPNVYRNIGASAPANMDKLITRRIDDTFVLANNVYWNGWYAACLQQSAIPVGTYLILEYTKTTD